MRYRIKKKKPATPPSISHPKPVLYAMRAAIMEALGELTDVLLAPPHKDRGLNAALRLRDELARSLTQHAWISWSDRNDVAAFVDGQDLGLEYYTEDDDLIHTPNMKRLAGRIIAVLTKHGIPTRWAGKVTDCIYITHIQPDEKQ